MSRGDRELIPFAPVLGDRARDGVVKTSVQETKILRADGRVRFHGQLGDRLADVAVIVHDLGHGEPLKQKIVPVQDRASADVLTRGLPEAQGVDQLIQEQGNSVIDFRFCGRRKRSHRHLRPAAADDLVPVRRYEFMEHCGNSCHGDRKLKLRRTVVQ